MIFTESGAEIHVKAKENQDETWEQGEIGSD